MERETNSKLQKMRDIYPYLLSGFSAILVDLACFNYYLNLLLFISYIPFIYGVINKSLKNAFFIGTINGMLLVILFMWPISISDYKVFLLLLFYKGVLMGIIGIIFELIRRYTLKILYFISIAAIWTVIEWFSEILKGYGFPSNLAFVLYQHLALIQIASITGIYGVSFLIILMNGLIYQIIEEIRVGKKRTAIYLRSTLGVGILLFVNLYGIIKLNKSEYSKDNVLKVAVVQSGFPNWVCDTALFSPYHMELILNTYLTLIQVSIREKPDIIVCPESCVPFSEVRDKLSRLIHNLNTTLIIGTEIKKGDRLFNSCLVLHKGKIVSEYDKNFLVPFRENIYTPGIHNNAIKSPFGKIGVSICYESLYPQRTRKYIKNNARLLLVITNDSSFKKSKIPYLHAAASIFRAIESGRFLLRSAESGVSMIISPKGEILKTTKLFEPDIIFSKIYLQESNTFYSTWGNWFIYMCVCFLFFNFGINFIRR